MRHYPTGKGGTFLNCDYVRCDDEGTQDLFRSVKEARGGEENNKAWKRFMSQVDESLGVKNYMDVWLGELTPEGEHKGVDGYTMNQQEDILKQAGFSRIFSLWQECGDRVFGGVK